MKLLSVKQARSIWFVPFVDLNPRGLNLHTLIRPIVEKYKFVIIPTKSEELDLSKGVKFEGGSFQKDLKEEISVNFTVFNDGIVTDTRSSTEHSDAFLEQFFNWMTEDFGLTPFKEVLRSKVYLSELWVKTDKSLNYLNPKLEKFAKRLTSLIVGHEHHPIKFETSGIYFWTNPTITNPPGPFRFERAGDFPFDENRYYSTAPLQTDIHLEMLDELESILMS
jgi:hypothetical protein